MIGLFFHVRGMLKTHTIPLEDAEDYGNFKTTSVSHDEVWQREFGRGMAVDFDYFPRGRVVYNKRTERYTVFIDKCLDTPERIEEIAVAFGLPGGGYGIEFDEHYQCHRCNRDYII
jgi:hypothetical protein